MAPHDPSRFSTYFQTHSTIMGQLRDSGFVGADTLRVDRFPGHFLMHGEIGCLGRIVITVQKLLMVVGEVAGEPQIQTVRYSYNVSIRGGRGILRYDNTHPGPRYPGHHDDHHKHLFDWKTGDELPGSPIWVGEAGWPTLGQVIDEVRQWYYDHLDELAEPHEYAEPRQKVY